MQISIFNSQRALFFEIFSFGLNIRGRYKKNYIWYTFWHHEMLLVLNNLWCYYILSHLFGSLKICCEITMGKGIIRIYIYIQQNWPYPSTNTKLFLPQRYDSYIKTEHTSDCDASIDARALEFVVAYQSNILHVHTDVNNNDD